MLLSRYYWRHNLIDKLQNFRMDLFMVIHPKKGLRNMHEWVNHLFFPSSEQSANVKIQKTAAHPKLAARNRLMNYAIGKLWGGVENRWVIWPWRSSAICVWKHQPGLSNMSGQFDELMDKKKGTLRCSRPQRAEKHNTKKTVIPPSICAVRNCTEPGCVMLRFPDFCQLDSNNKLKSQPSPGSRLN